MKKNYLAFLFIALLGFSLFTGCKNNGGDPVIPDWVGTWIVGSGTTVTDITDGGSVDVTSEWTSYKLVLNQDNSYALTRKDLDGNVLATPSTGTYTYDETNGTISFSAKDDNPATAVVISATAMTFEQDQTFVKGNIRLRFNSLQKQ